MKEIKGKEKSIRMLLENTRFSIEYYQREYKWQTKQNPGFLRFMDENDLAFKAHPHFKKQDLDERQELYRALAELIWSPERITKAVQS